MRRAWLWIVAVGAGSVGAALLASFLYIDVIARDLIVHGSTRALGVDTSLDLAYLGLLSRSFRLAGLDVENPPGFEESHFLRVGEARLDLDLGTLRQSTVRVPRFSIQKIEVDLDKRQGKANYAVILDNLARFESKGPEPTAAAGGEEPARRFVIDALVIRDVEAHVRVLEAGRLGKVDVIVPEVLVRNLGGAGRPLTVAEVTSVVVKAVLASIVQAGAGLPGGVTRALSGGLGRLADVSVELPQGGRLANAATDVLGAGVEAAGDALDTGRAAARDVGGRLKGLGDKLSGK